MVECPPFSKDTPIYHAMLHFIYAILTLIAIFIITALLLKCPKRVKSIKYQLIALQIIGNFGMFMPTEGEKKLDLVHFLFFITNIQK